MNHEIMKDMECIMKTLTSYMNAEVSAGKNEFDTKSAGETSDMIKDVAEAMKECYEACYYKTVAEAMKEGGSPAYGYNHWHMSNGEFASRGNGHYVRGYNEMPYMDQQPYVDAYLHDPDFKKNMMTHGASRDGELYDNYHNAKRHYHDSRSLKDRDNMETHCMAYMDKTLKNMRSIWEEADPSLKTKMKKDFGDDIAEFLEGKHM